VINTADSQIRPGDIPMQYQPVTNSVNPLAKSVQLKLILTLMVTAVLPFSILATVLGPGLLNVGGVIAIFVLLAGLVAATYVSSRMIRQTSAINGALNCINQGDFEARAEIITADELGKTAAALNALCDNTLNLIQSHEERDQIQSSIESLISEMEQIAAGT
jgi:methyl-accepting chemotaxis protein